MDMRILFGVYTIVFLLCCACNKEDDSICKLNMDNFDNSFGIDYNNPDLYLTPGEQSDLKDEYLEEIRLITGTPELNMEGMRTICDWFEGYFSFINKGGDMIGKPTIDELYVSKTFYGCHSAALILTSVLREFGFPTVIIETASVEWAYNYIEDTNIAFMGHVMTEVYVDGKWILLDNNDNCGMNLDYDPLTPHITSSGQINYGAKGLFCYAKGKDSWDYGVRSETDTHELMINFANNLSCFEDMMVY